MSTNDPNFLDNPADGGVDYAEDLPGEGAPKKGGAFMRIALMGGGVFLVILIGFAGLVMYPKYKAQQEAKKRPFAARVVEPLPAEPSAQSAAPAPVAALPETITPQPPGQTPGAPGLPGAPAPLAAAAATDANLPAGFSPPAGTPAPAGPAPVGAAPPPPIAADPTPQAPPSAPAHTPPPSSPSPTTAAVAKAPAAPMLDDRLVAKTSPKPVSAINRSRPAVAAASRPSIPGTRLPDHVDVESARLDEWKPMD